MKYIFSSSFNQSTRFARRNRANNAVLPLFGGVHSDADASSRAIIASADARPSHRFTQLRRVRAHRATVDRVTRAESRASAGDAL